MSFYFPPRRKCEFSGQRSPSWEISNHTVKGRRRRREPPAVALALNETPRQSRELSCRSAGCTSLKRFSGHTGTWRMAAPTASSSAPPKARAAVVRSFAGQLATLATASAADPVTGPERQDQQAGNSKCQAELRSLAYEGYAAPREGLIAQRRISKPEGGVGVAPRDKATDHHRHEAPHGQDCGWKPGRLRLVAFAGCVVVFPHAGESSWALAVPEAAPPGARSPVRSNLGNITTLRLPVPPA